MVLGASAQGPHHAGGYVCKELGPDFLPVLRGAVNTAWPRGVWYLDIGWKVKDVEPLRLLSAGAAQLALCC